MAGQYPENSRLIFPWSLFGGCFHHLFVATTSFEILKTILKRSSNARVPVFAMDATSFEVFKTILKRSSNACVPVFAMGSTSFEVPRLGTYKILKDWVSCHVLLSGSLQNFSPDLSPKSPPNRLHGKINLEFSEYWPAIGQLKLIF